MPLKNARALILNRGTLDLLCYIIEMSFRTCMLEILIPKSLFLKNPSVRYICPLARVTLTFCFICVQIVLSGVVDFMVPVSS